MSKRFSFVMIAIMLLGLLVACGETTTVSPTTGTTSTTAPVVEATKPADATMAPEATKAPTTGGVELPEVDPATVKGDIVTAGSSTVFPLSEAIAEEFKKEGFTNGKVTIDSIGSGAGIERFCKAAETDIANASRAMKDSEIKQCAEKGREVIEFRVGTDALAIVVSSKNTFVSDLTEMQIANIYSGTYKLWSDVDPSFPKEAIKLYSPGTDSGTFDYFVEHFLNKDKALILGANPQLSEDDNVLVQGVEGSPYAIGYFGYAYYKENSSKLKALKVGGVEPNEKTAEDGTYKVARPLYIYSAKNILKEKPQVAAFINYYLTTVNDLILDVGYFPASDEALNEAKQHLLDATK